MCRLAMLMLLMTFKTLTCGEMRALPHEEAGRSCHPNSIERTSVVSSPLGLNWNTANFNSVCVSESF